MHVLAFLLVAVAFGYTPCYNIPAKYYNTGLKLDLISLGMSFREYA